MSKVILMSAFVLLHSLWCLFEIFGHFNFQYCFHLIPYYIFIELLKLNTRNFKKQTQNADQEIDISLVIAQRKETTEKFSESTDNKSTDNYENVKFETTIETRFKSDTSSIDIQQSTYAISSEIEETNSSKKLSPFTLRNNVSDSSDQSSENSCVTPLVQGSKYLFYDDYGEKFIIDNAEFEEEENEQNDIFNSNSTFLHSNPNSEFLQNRSYNEACHFYPISTNASSGNHTDEDEKENTVDSSQRKNIFRKMKSILLKFE
ncbi:hypothetical protein TNCV_376041 [Trichonephila clavipes]|nr:hypothetical protein TNCV_376041 [Trichonephila clavipes]